jgi:hypothetical protein
MTKLHTDVNYLFQIFLVVMCSNLTLFYQSQLFQIQRYSEWILWLLCYQNALSATLVEKLGYVQSSVYFT